MFFKRSENKRRRLPSWLPTWLDAPIRFLFRISFALILLGFSVSCYYWYQACQYDIEKVAETHARTLILDAAGQEFATVGGERRRLITYEEIPQALKVALYAREDQDFESHWGVKFTGLARATVRNIKDGKFTQGGSTLSMQLIKNTYENREKTISRKLLEIALTFRLEAHYSKDEILTHYLNRIYFGAGCYGIEEASLTYFGKSTKDLNQSQAALLAGIIRGPEVFSPFNAPDKAIEQRDQVIDRMLAIGSITQQQSDEIKSQALNFQKKEKSISQSSYSLQLVKRHLKEVFTEDELNAGDITVQTSLNPEIVGILDATAKTLSSDKSYLTAGVVLDSKSGAILGINGGPDVRTSPWNIALDSKRTMGGIFTPLLYLASVDQGEDPILGQAVQTGRLLDMEKLIRFCKKLQLNDKFKADEDLYRGYAFTSPLKLATAYSLFATDGKLPHTYVIKNANNSLGEQVYSHPQKSETITPAGNIAIIKELLGINGNDALIYQSLKQGELDAWTVAADHQYVVLLWCGLPDSKTLSGPPAPLLKAMKQQALRILAVEKHP